MPASPIDSLPELWSWKSTDNRRFEMLNYRKPEGREIMVCHDMKGGYLPEESDDGYDIEDSQPYTFLNWWNIDIFCYFSHHFVTIPPEGYVKVAHEHGCIVMGTFITEWKDGEKLCSEFLTKENIVKTVQSLVQISKDCSIDGWLINIENKLEKEQVDLMLDFLKLLTSEMRKVVPYSRVIWYDSVLHNGKLLWQNELNNQNNKFYESCDGIYLNYNWNETNLMNSADFGELSKIFVGIDCFARGCIGGWECDKSFRLLCLLQMSVALFAPGWIAEKFPKDNQIDMGLKFWNKLCNTTQQRKVTSLPLKTDFNPGFKNSYKNFNLSAISLQPNYTNKNIVPTENGLLIKGRGTYKLFDCDIKCNSRISLKVQSSAPVSFYLNDSLYQGPMDIETLQSVTVSPEQDHTYIESIHIYE